MKSTPTAAPLPKGILLLSLALCLGLACASVPHRPADRRPNLLWIYLEDTSPLMGAYGTTTIATPHIDALAASGAVFLRAFAPAPVCSPSRSAVITGTMATTLGLHNHHSSRTEDSAIHLPCGYLTIPELFREAGYFTFNDGKDDYNFDYDRRALYEGGYSRHALYGKRGDHVDLGTLVDQQPFFGQIQLAGGKGIFSSAFEERVASPVDRALVQLPPHLPDHPAIVEEYARHLDAIQVTDRRLGRILDELRAHGLLENTVVFFFSDHGMRLTRHKQFLYDGGIHIPLIIADYRERPCVAPASRVDALVSGIDIGTSSLALADLPIPEWMEGLDLLSPSFRGREFIVATRDRCDFTIDRIRAIRTSRFKYIRNGMTDRPRAQPTYMDVNGVEFVEVMRELHAQGRLNAAQAQFFAHDRPREEFYDLENDPFELVNLAGTERHERERARHAAILDAWIQRTGDRGQKPEGDAGLLLMLGIWGDHATNPEYDALRRRHPGLSGSQFELKSRGWER